MLRCRTRLRPIARRAGCMSIRLCLCIDGRVTGLVLKVLIPVVQHKQMHQAATDGTCLFMYVDMFDTTSYTNSGLDMRSRWNSLVIVSRELRSCALIPSLVTCTCISPMLSIMRRTNYWTYVSNCWEHNLVGHSSATNSFVGVTNAQNSF